MVDKNNAAHYWSAKTCGFYPEPLLPVYEKAGTLPDDLVLVTDEIYREFGGAAPEGKSRGVDDAGMPVWEDTFNRLIHAGP